MKSIIYLLSFLYRAKKIWKKPSRKNYLVIDVRNSQLMFRYIDKNDTNILHVRGECVNVYVLLYTLFYSVLFLRFNNFHLQYVNSFIQISKAKICITLNHPKLFFYKLKNYNKKLITIVFQNSHSYENEDKFYIILKNEKKKNNLLEVDFFLCNNKFFFKNIFEKYILSNFISAGSFKNNFYYKKKNLIKINKNPSTQNKIAFISQFRLPQNITRAGYDYNKFYSTEKFILPKLYNFAKKNNYQLIILGSEWDTKKEIAFYNNLIGNVNWVLKKRTLSNLSYYATDDVEFSVFVDSTLGFESLARGNKTISFNFKGKIDPMFDKFGFDFLKNRGKFWTNIKSQFEFDRLINYVNRVSPHEWNRDNRKIINKIMSYDPNNKIFQKILSRNCCS